MDSATRRAGRPSGSADRRAGRLACDGTTGGENEEPKSADLGRAKRSPAA